MREGDVIHVISMGPEFCLTPLPVYPPPSPLPTPTHAQNHSHTHTYLRLHNQQGILITFPDIMITPTRIADACACPRKSLLSDLLRGGVGGGGGMSALAVMGSVKHVFVERVMEAMVSSMQRQTAVPKNPATLIQSLSPAVVPGAVQESISQFIEQLVSVGVEKGQEVRAALSPLLFPLATYTHSLCTEGLRKYVNRLQPAGSSSPWQAGLPDLSLASLFSLEEGLEVKVVGVKGQMDMVALAWPAAAGTNGGTGDGIRRPVFLPIELKTGTWRGGGAATHRAQVILYLFLLHLREMTRAGEVFKVSHRTQRTTPSYIVPYIIHLTYIYVAADLWFVLPLRPATLPLPAQPR